MLNTFTVKFIEEFGNLTISFIRIFIERNTDFAIGRRECLGRQASIFTFNIEVANFLEVENLFIEISPILHTAFIHIMGQMVDFI